MDKLKIAWEIYGALKSAGADIGNASVPIIEDVLEGYFEPDSSLCAAAPALLKALEMADAASTVYDSDELTPLQDEIRKAAKAAGVTPSQYVKSVIRAAIAGAKGME